MKTGKARKLTRFYLFGGLACFTLWSYTPQIHATEWTYGFPAALSLQYDDNLNLTTTDETSAYRLRLIPSVLMQRETDRSRFDLDLSLWIDRYYDTDARSDRNDPRLKATFDHEFSRSEVGGAVKYMRRPTLESQFEDTGQANVTDSQDTVELSAYGQHDLDERTALGVDGMFRDVSYTTDRLTDYRYGLINLISNNQRDPGLSLKGFTTVARLTPETNSSESALDTNTYLLGVGGEYAWSELIGLEMWIGAFYAEQLEADSTSGLQGRFALTYKSEFVRSTASAARTQQPSGSGTLRMQDEVRLLLARDLTDRSSSGVEAYWRNSSDLFDENDSNGVALGDQTREEIRFAPWFKWQWTESVSLRLSYMLRRLQRVDESDWATSNAVLLGLEYIPLL